MNTVLAVVLGTLPGIGRLASHLLARAICTACVEALRNVPLLVLYCAATHLQPDSTEPLQLLPGWLLSKGGLSMPWPVHVDGAW